MIDTSVRISNFFDRASKDVSRASQISINRTAFALRRETPEILKEKLQNPSPVTLRSSVARVQRASGTSGFATLEISNLQRKWLLKLEYGLPSERVVMPADRSAKDRYGNVKRSFYLNSDRLASLVASGRAFVGVPANISSARWGIWLITARGGLRSLTAVEFDRPNKPTLNLRQTWSEKASVLLRRNFSQELRRTFGSS